MDLRLTLAILLGKTIGLLSKLTGTGGTAAPGLYALKIDPDLVKKLSAKIKNGAIIISGTNGKTTTARIAFDLLSKKSAIVHNRQGSNLMRGIASTLISKTSLWGKVRANLAIWEVDEATLQQAYQNTSAHTIALLNLFRDQLDRYGEVDTILKKWRLLCQSLPKSTALILNADDPAIASLANVFNGKIITFGAETQKTILPTVSNVSDIKQCPVCGQKLSYKNINYAHVGEFQCTSCNFKRPPRNISATNISFSTDFSTSFNIKIQKFAFNTKCGLPGIYNVYNILAATAIAHSQSILPAEIKRAIPSFTPAFGRFQKSRLGSKNICIFLIKNPTGANEVVRSLCMINNINLLVILNDNFADGLDVSWIWDTNWEALQSKVKTVTVSGQRCFDMALRLKYADFNMSKDFVYEQIKDSIFHALSHMNKNDTLYILPTYTALLEIDRNLKQERGDKKWQNQ